MVNGWVAIDNQFYEELKKLNRKLTRLEAAFWFTHDLNKNKEWSINMYSKMWGWSRNKVRKFVKDARSKNGSIKSGKKNQKGHPIALLGNGSIGHKDTHAKLSDNQKGHPGDNGANVFHGYPEKGTPKRTPLTVGISGYPYA